MMESSIPFAAAVEAAPILKLWPTYNEQSISASVRSSQNRDVNLGGSGKECKIWKNLIADR